MNRRHFTASALAWTLCPWPLLAESSNLREALTRRSYEISRRLTSCGWRSRDGLYWVQLAGEAPPSLALYLLPPHEYLIVTTHRPQSQLTTEQVSHEIRVQLLDQADESVVAAGQYIDDPGATVIKYQPPKPRHFCLQMALKQPENAQELVALCFYR